MPVYNGVDYINPKNCGKYFYVMDWRQYGTCKTGSLPKSPYKKMFEDKLKGMAIIQEAIEGAIEDVTGYTPEDVPSWEGDMAEVDLEFMKARREQMVQNKVELNRIIQKAVATKSRADKMTTTAILNSYLDILRDNNKELKKVLESMKKIVEKTTIDYGVRETFFKERKDSDEIEALSSEIKSMYEVSHILEAEMLGLIAQVEAMFVDTDGNCISDTFPFYDVKNTAEIKCYNDLSELAAIEIGDKKDYPKAKKLLQGSLRNCLEKPLTAFKGDPPTKGDPCTDVGEYPKIHERLSGLTSYYCAGPGDCSKNVFPQHCTGKCQWVQGNVATASQIDPKFILIGGVILMLLFSSKKK